MGVGVRDLVGTGKACFSFGKWAISLDLDESKGFPFNSGVESAQVYVKYFPIEVLFPRNRAQSSSTTPYPLALNLVGVFRSMSSSDLS